jgi:ATP-binding cassette subfamily F protein 3
MSENDSESQKEKKISIPESIAPKQEKEGVTEKEIYSVIQSYFPNNQFDDFILDYISKMIYLDHPENESDLKALVGDYLEDKLIYPENKKEEICSKIYKQLYKDKSKLSRRAIIAEKLKQPIKLSEISVGSKNKINSINFDANALTFHIDKLYTETVTGLEQKKEYVADKNKIKEMNEFMETIRREKLLAMTEVEINHDKNESHRIDINIPTFTIHIGGKTLLEDATLKIAFGRRYVLIGRNGVGKTTLLNHIARKEIDGIPKNIQIVHVEQEVIINDNELLYEVLSCDKERLDLLNEVEEVNNAILKEKNEKELKKLSKKLVDVNKRLEEIDANEAENRAKFILLGLGFKEEDFTKKTKDFSGGWRVRISLAKALFVMPDLLLLDEPTNHLDMNAVMWLEDYLINWPYTLVIVSHAKDFINNIATDIIHLTNQKLNYYKGNYLDFERERTEKIKQNHRIHEAQVKKMEHMQEFIDRFRYKAKRANLVQSRIKQMNKMEIVEEILEDPTCIFIFPEPTKINPPVLRLDNADLGYNGKVIVEKINLSVDMSSRIALVGANGCGKTTLLKGLVGDLIPMKGLCYRHGKLRLGLFRQHHVDQLDLELSPLEELQKYYPNLETEKIRGHLSQFGIGGNLSLRPNYLLSGGQKSRVALALIMLNNPQILLMDEPTNHLDLDAINALVVALSSYEGGLLIVSHDQNFVEQVCTQIYMIENKRLKQFRGNFNDYRKYLRSQSDRNRQLKLK